MKTLINPSLAILALISIKVSKSSVSIITGRFHVHERHFPPTDRDHYWTQPVGWGWSAPNHDDDHKHEHDSGILVHKCDICGRKNHRRFEPDDETKKAIAVHEIPWRCYLKHSEIENCGATIISSQWIMTAAHCLDLLDKELLENGAGVTVTCGDYDRNSISDASHVSISAQKIIVHEDYNKGIAKSNNDIALIKLSQRLTWNHNIRPVCLPFDGQDEKCEKQNRPVLYSGWGETKLGSETSHLLMRVQVPCLSRENCQGIYENDNVKISHNMFCTYASGSDTCQGDTGGSVDYEDDGCYYAIGIVSFGKSCPDGDDPGVHTKVANYLNWIRHKTDYYDP